MTEQSKIGCGPDQFFSFLLIWIGIISLSILCAPQMVLEPSLWLPRNNGLTWGLAWILFGAAAWWAFRASNDFYLLVDQKLLVKNIYETPARPGPNMGAFVSQKAARYQIERINIVKKGSFSYHLVDEYTGKKIATLHWFYYWPHTIKKIISKIEMIQKHA